jgi:purine-nucleoside phosphorylase
MSAPFDTDLSALVRRVASDLSIEVKEGTYAGVLGPAYETAAEIRMLARLGADVVGMSTVPEVIAAHALGLRLVVLSLVTNRATGLSGGRISHDDVLSMGQAAGVKMVRLVTEVVGQLGARERPSQSMGAK